MHSRICGHVDTVGKFGDKCVFGGFRGENEGKKRERGLVGEMGGVAC